MRRAGVVLSLVFLSAIVAGCGGSSNWRGEFTEGLGGASHAVEESLPEFGPGAREPALFRAGIYLGRRLAHKGEAIEGLDPPSECGEVQEAGSREVHGAAQKVFDLYKNLTPTLRRSLPGLLKEDLAKFEHLEREANFCEGD
jgi:hypothetical protein